MKEISEYKLLEENDGESLSRLVNEYITKGWKLYGTPFSRTRNNWGTVSQAIVKYKE